MTIYYAFIDKDGRVNLTVDAAAVNILKDQLERDIKSAAQGSRFEDVERNIKNRNVLLEVLPEDK